MKNNSEYMKLINEARQKELKIIQDQYVYIKDLYEDVANDLKIKSSKAKKGSLTKRWLKDYEKSIKREIEELNRIIYLNNKESIKTSAQIASNIQVDFLNQVNRTYNLGLGNIFTNTFSDVANTAALEIINGGLYKDGKGLDSRIWTNRYKLNKDIDYIINKGIIEGKSAYELAQDISKYVNPYAKKDFEWEKVYPGVGNKKVDYNAQRLARTAINHSFFLSNARSCEKNPFVEAMHWELSVSHFERQVSRFGEDECDEYTKHDEGLGQGNFKVNELPLPHPQCLCAQWAVIPKSMEEIGTELRDWIDGKPNEKLDDWYRNHGLEFAGLNNVFHGKNNNRNGKTGATKEARNGIIKVDNRNSKVGQYKPRRSNLRWNKYLDISERNSNTLNEIHTELNEFMIENHREKMILLDIQTNSIIYELIGTKDNEIILTNETIKLLKSGKTNSIIFAHNHPSKTTFSRYDIQHIIKHKSIKALTVECLNGNKYMLDRGELKSSVIKDLGFESKYDKIYWKVAKKYPELNDEVKRYEVWDIFLHDVNEEVARAYGMNYKKVIE